MSHASYSRTSHDSIRDLVGPEIQVLRALHAHSLPYPVMMSMRVAGSPVTRAHLRMASPKCGNPDAVPMHSDAPATRLLKRPVAPGHLAEAALIYDKLDAAWRETGTVDALHLLSSWEIFVNSMTVDPGRYQSSLTRPPNPKHRTPVVCRDHWITVRALVTGMLTLDWCESCGMPQLRVLDAPLESNWLMLPATCGSCALKATLRRTRLRKQLAGSNSAHVTAAASSSQDFVLKVVR